MVAIFAVLFAQLKIAPAFARPFLANNCIIELLS